MIILVLLIGHYTSCAVFNSSVQCFWLLSIIATNLQVKCFQTCYLIVLVSAVRAALYGRDRCGNAFHRAHDRGVKPAPSPQHVLPLLRRHEERPEGAAPQGGGFTGQVPQLRTDWQAGQPPAHRQLQEESVRQHGAHERDRNGSHWPRVFHPQREKGRLEKPLHTRNDRKVWQLGGTKTVGDRVKICGRTNELS